MSEKPLAPQQARSKATEDALLQALDRLLAAQSLESVTVAEIAAEAGLTTGAIYRRFKDKRGMLIAAINRGIEQFEALEIANPKGYAPGLPDDQLVMNLIHDYFGIAFDNLRTMQALAFVRDEQTYTSLMAARAGVAAWFAGLLQSSCHSKESLAHKVNFVLRTSVSVYLDTLRVTEPGLSREQYMAKNKTQMERLFAELHQMACLYLGVTVEPK